MLGNGTHACANRIVSIFQPHIRPIVRGKAKVEFGAKIGVSIYNGYSFVDHHSWDAYNESSDSEIHTRLFEQHFGCLPATILADKIYMNKTNRNFLKANEIKTYSKPLGRPSKEPRQPEYYDNMAQVILVGSALVTDLQRLARNPIILSFLIYAECSALP